MSISFRIPWDNSITWLASQDRREFDIWRSIFHDSCIWPTI